MPPSPRVAPARVALALGVALVIGPIGSSAVSSAVPPPRAVTPAPAADGAATACVGSGSGRDVRRPRHVRRIDAGETGWFSSPGLVDLDGDGRLEIVAPFYSTFVYDAAGKLLGKGTAGAGRVYPPSVVADLEGDGVVDIVTAGNEGTVAAYEFRAGKLVGKPGWPASTRSGGQAPEARGIAAADLDGDGTVEVAVTTTNTSDTGAQVFVFDAAGRLFQPAGGHSPAWPRDNQLPGPGNDRDFNGVGNHGYGAYGENVAIGNIDDDSDLEIVVTFDNHQINAFNLDGTSVLASSWFTNRSSEAEGERLGWGQFIRWADPRVERRHYHRHTGAWPSPEKQAWLQWTASPPVIADLDGDGRHEVIGIPNVERHIPYKTVAHAFMVLDGAYGDGSRSARRHPGFTRLPMSNRPVHRPSGDWYPPTGIPAPTIVDISGDDRQEIVAALPGGKVYAVGPDGKRLWSTTYAPRRAKVFASEVVAADLNRDGRPELVFGTYSLKPGGGRLVVLSASGRKLFDQKLKGQRRDGNGIGVAAAPSIADLTGDGPLEVVLTTIDHGVDVYTVPGSASGCLPWPTGRGNLLRNGTVQPPA